jgi:hypothetical protein
MITQFATVAAEHSEGLTVGLLAEFGVIAVSILLTIATIGLWKATAMVHKDEVTKMTAGLIHDNDNMTRVARDAMEQTHREHVRELRAVAARKHRVR